jgi:hypothetical protein
MESFTQAENSYSKPFDCEYRGEKGKAMVAVTWVGQA